ncbi:MAG: hypothetical protein KDD82_22045, partial [Planctomycetes bacterium]|nr:hypothetical protein [Planctomycetota bacterium]
VQERLRLKRDRGAKPQAAELFTLAIELGDPSADPHAHLVRVTPPVADQRERLRTLVEEHPSGLAYGLLAAHYAYVEPRVWDTALELIERSVAADPRDPQSLAAAGNLYVGWLQAHRSTAPEKLARAEALLEGALELAPEDPLVLERFAYGWRILGEQFPAQAGGVGPEALARYTRARELMLSTLGRYPGCFGARKELVDCVRHLEGPAQALVALAPLLELYPQEGELHYIRYKFLGELRRYDEALQAIEAAARLEPERADFNELARRFRAQLGR